MTADVPTHVSILEAEHAGHGVIGRKTAIVLAFVFITAIWIPGIYQIIYEETTLHHWQFTDLLMHKPSAAEFQQFEKDLTQQSRFDRWVRHTYNTVTTGTAIPPKTTIVGYNGFLFTVEETNCYTSYPLNHPPTAETDPLPAMTDFAAQLHSMGIELVLLPIPMKATIYPEDIAIDYRPSDGPAYPPGYLEWVDRAKSAGLNVLEFTPELWAAKGKSSEPFFWRTDTHLSYPGREVSDDIIAARLRSEVGSLPHIQFNTGKFHVEFMGNLVDVITRGFGSTRYPPISFDCVAPESNGSPLICGDDAPILLLGDSYAGLGNAEGYGMADGLMLRTLTEIQALGIPADPVHTPRLELARNPGYLTRKKLVIWEFAVERLWGKWDKIAIHPK